MIGMFLLLARVEDEDEWTIVGGGDGTFAVFESVMDATLEMAELVENEEGVEFKIAQLNEVPSSSYLN
jgi:hypothetical protein